MAAGVAQLMVGVVGVVGWEDDPQPVNRLKPTTPAASSSMIWRQRHFLKTWKHCATVDVAPPPGNSGLELFGPRVLSPGFDLASFIAFPRGLPCQVVLPALRWVMGDRERETSSDLVAVVLTLAAGKRKIPFVFHLSHSPSDSSLHRSGATYSAPPAFYLLLTRHSQPSCSLR